MFNENLHKRFKEFKDYHEHGYHMLSVLMNSWVSSGSVKKYLLKDTSLKEDTIRRIENWIATNLGERQCELN